jgi:biopolymer transport protein ExbB
MIPLLALSLVAVAIILERLWVLRRSNYLKEDTVSTLSHYLTERQLKAAVGFCKVNPGPFTHLVSAMIDNRFAPYDELKEILEDTGRRELLGLQRGLPALGTIVAGAPLLGLLGTVLGMIDIFRAVASAGTGITEQLATGISRALITTATGLIIAIPALFVHSYLESKAVGILTDVEGQIVDFLHLVRGPEPGPESESGGDAS